MEPSKKINVLRWEGVAKPFRASDELATEEPLEIHVETRPISVTMRTPGHDEELAAGFLLTEGLIKCRGDIARVENDFRNPAGNRISVLLAPEVPIDFSRLTRHVFASSSCGLCGKVTIESVQQQFPPMLSSVSVSAEFLQGLPTRLAAAQETFARTGGLHGAAIFDLGGALVVAREDVGRHNAVDKVLGFGLLHGLLPFDHHVMLVSGRASFEIMQKALAARVPIVAAVSAPSSLAVEFAESSRQTLVGFLRENRMNIYSGGERVQFPSLES